MQNDHSEQFNYIKQAAFELYEREIRDLDLDLSPMQHTALLSLLTSIGLMAFRNSTLRTLLLSKVATPSDIRRAFHWWIRWEVNGKVCIDPAMIDQRRREADLFLDGSEKAPID